MAGKRQHTHQSTTTSPAVGAASWSMRYAVLGRRDDMRPPLSMKPRSSFGTRPKACSTSRFVHVAVCNGHGKTQSVVFSNTVAILVGNTIYRDTNEVEVHLNRSHLGGKRSCAKHRHGRKATAAQVKTHFSGRTERASASHRWNSAWFDRHLGRGPPLRPAPV